MTFEIEIYDNLTFDKKNVKNLNYPEILKIESDFKIFFNNKLWFNEKYFSIIEFLLYCKEWLASIQNNKEKDFEFYSIDNDIADGAIISFIRINDSYKIKSCWQIFEVTNQFQLKELIDFIDKLEVLVSTQLKNKYDIKFA